MTVLVLVNALEGLSTAQTTLGLIAGLNARGHAVAVADVFGLSHAPDDHVVARARLLAPNTATTASAVTRALSGPDAAPAAPTRVEDTRLALIRTNPARDKAHAWAHGTALDLMRLAQDRGVPVLNRPDGLVRASSKLYLARLPRHLRPRTLISHDAAELRDFVLNAPGPCVLKPLQGTWGQDVYKVHKATENNLNAILAALTRGGHAIAQDFIPEATAGDTRLLVVDGELLKVGGYAAGVARVPSPDDFRSNVHAGGKAQAAVVTETMREAVAAIGPILREDGIWLAGLDFIGGKIIEVNVFSPGGLPDCERFTGQPFTAQVIARLEDRMRPL